MADHATPNLRSRDFEATSRFYARPGFGESWRVEGRMIIERGRLKLQFLPHPELDPADSSFSACPRLDDVDGFYAQCLAAGLMNPAAARPACIRRAARPRAGASAR